MKEMKNKMAPSCLSRRAGSEHVLLYLEKSISKTDLRSCQGQVMTHVGQYAYLSKSFDEPSRLAPFARLISILSRVIGEKRIVTSCDLR